MQLQLHEIAKASKQTGRWTLECP